MNWKKNGFSYLMWLVYTVAVGSSSLYTAMNLGFVLTQNKILGIFLWVFVLLFAGLIVILSYRLVGRYLRKLKRRLMKAKATGSAKVNFFTKILFSEGKHFYLEILFLMVLSVIGILLRAGELANITEVRQEAAYFEAAAMADTSIPQFVHGAVYIYLHLLRGVSLLFGHSMAVYYWVQILLQIIGNILFYFAIKRLNGRVTGAAVFIGCTFSPFLIREAIILSPRVLFLFVLCIGIFGISFLTKSKSCKAIVGFLSGIAIGILGYLDVMGILLLILAAGLMFLTEEKDRKLRKKRIAILLSHIAGGIIGFISAIWLDSALSAKSFLGVFGAWYTLFAPEDFQFSLLLENFFGFFPVVLLFLLIMGIFSFWCSKRYEGQGIWVFCCMVLMLLQCFQVTTEEMRGFDLLYLFLLILAGESIASIFRSIRTQLLLLEKKAVAAKKGIQTNKKSEKVSAEKEKENSIKTPKIELLNLSKKKDVKFDNDMF